MASRSRTGSLTGASVSRESNMAKSPKMPMQKMPMTQKDMDRMMKRTMKKVGKKSKKR